MTASDNSETGFSSFSLYFNLIMRQHKTSFLQTQGSSYFQCFTLYDRNQNLLKYQILYSESPNLQKITKPLIKSDISIRQLALYLNCTGNIEHGVQSIYHINSCLSFQ